MIHFTSPEWIFETSIWDIWYLRFSFFEMDVPPSHSCTPRIGTMPRSPFRPGWLCHQSSCLPHRGWRQRQPWQLRWQLKGRQGHCPPLEPDIGPIRAQIALVLEITNIGQRGFKFKIFIHSIFWGRQEDLQQNPFLYRKLWSHSPPSSMLLRLCCRLIKGCCCCLRHFRLVTCK